MFGGYFVLCFPCLTEDDMVIFLLCFPALTFFGAFLLLTVLNTSSYGTAEGGGPPAGDRFISSSKYLLLASSAATLSRDWMMANVK